MYPHILYYTARRRREIDRVPPPTSSRGISLIVRGCFGAGDAGIGQNIESEGEKGGDGCLLKWG